MKNHKSEIFSYYILLKLSQGDILDLYIGIIFQKSHNFIQGKLKKEFTIFVWYLIAIG